MTRLGRYWLFFVIVAVGLALSWGQVGRKAQRALDSSPVVYLHTETPCRPQLAPCAAVAGDRALVLGPAQNGLLVKQAGLRDDELRRPVKMQSKVAIGKVTAELVDYRVRDLDSSDGTSARVRVLCQHSDGDGVWGTVGVHENIIDASWKAVVEGLVIGLMREKRRNGD